MTLPTLREATRDLLVRALEVHSGNRAHAAIAMGVNVRSVRKWVHEFGLVGDFPPSKKMPKRKRYVPKHDCLEKIFSIEELE